MLEGGAEFNRWFYEAVVQFPGKNPFKVSSLAGKNLLE
jgi:hypothetical protein